MKATSMRRTRAVYDCMIFLQGAASAESPAALCLLLAERRLVELCLSDAVLAEIKDVLGRPRLRQKFTRLTDEFVSKFLATLEGFSTMYRQVSEEILLTRDKKDEPYLNLAYAANADYLVTRDSDLLDIPFSTDADSMRIKELCPTLQFTDPVAFLRACNRLAN